ncbi:hypothetical protein HanRHA438_Chr11g0486041 [Helianthus annuus]|nr:hypothetical protein HanIR_Chr11g0509061 [Helianthus annuus]KAJ0869155.1 hypothetical protein HanRHA438_Chr11g0486041 [Helianthus annuus]
MIYRIRQRSLLLELNLVEYVNENCEEHTNSNRKSFLFLCILCVSHMFFLIERNRSLF